jgi:hypothetical protein
MIYFGNFFDHSGFVKRAVIAQYLNNFFAAFIFNFSEIVIFLVHFQGLLDFARRALWFQQLLLQVVLLLSRRALQGIFNMVFSSVIPGESPITAIVTFGCLKIH